MSLLSSILIVVIGCPVGILIIVYRNRIVETVGEIGFAEDYLGPGGTYTLFLILGLIVFIGSLMWSTGALQGILSAMFGSFF